MRNKSLKLTITTESSLSLASGAGHAPFQQLILSDNQKETIKSFYSINDAEECEGQLTEMLSIYIASSCPEFGELSEEDINKKSLVIKQITNLLFAIEPQRTN
ncbi:MAG: hypothetical protein V4708_16430 [Bacteroidota bacterium]